MLDRRLRHFKAKEVCPLDSATLPDHIPSHQNDKFFVSVASSSLLRSKQESVWTFLLRPLWEVCFPTPWILGQRRSWGAKGSWCVSLRSAGAQGPRVSGLSDGATSFVLRAWRQPWFTMSRAGYLPPCNPIPMWQWMLPHICLYVYKLLKSLLWDGSFFSFSWHFSMQYNVGHSLSLFIAQVYSF